MNLHALNDGFMPSDWPIVQQSEITDYLCNNLPDNDFVMTSWCRSTEWRWRHSFRFFNDNFQCNMFLQPKFVKTVRKWHASSINLTHCVKTQRVGMRDVPHIIYIQVRTFSTIGFTQSETGPPRQFAGPGTSLPWEPHGIIIFKLDPTRLLYC